MKKNIKYRQRARDFVKHTFTPSNFNYNIIYTIQIPLIFLLKKVTLCTKFSLYYFSVLDQKEERERGGSLNSDGERK